MKILISYDIGDNRIRLKVSNILIYYGFDRIQKSVFCGHTNRSILKKTIEQLRSLEMEKGNDSIIIIQMNHYVRELASDRLDSGLSEKVVEVI